MKSNILMFIFLSFLLLISSACNLNRSSGGAKEVTEIKYCEEAPVVGDFQSGDGTASLPFAICNLDQLNHFVSYCDLTAPNDCNGLFFILGNGIDLDSETFNPLDAFRGSFDGNDKTISNWTYVAAGAGDSAATIQANPGHVDYNVGFFRTLGDGALVKDLSLSNISIKGRYHTGGFAGYMSNGSLAQNIHVTTSGLVADVGTAMSGIIIGFNDYPTAGGSTGKTAGVVGEMAAGSSVTNSSFDGLVRGAMQVAGLVGNCMGSVSGSHTSGAVMGRDGNSGGFAGNIAGVGSSISNSYSTAKVIDVAGNSGGFVGSVNAGAHVTTSYYNGSMTGAGLGAGGFVGYVIGVDAKITKSYSSGSVGSANGGSYVGGFAGWVKDGGTIEDSYSTATITAGGWKGGFAGVVSNTAGVGTLKRVYAAGAAPGGVQAGDLVGYLGTTGVVLNSFADENVSVENFIASSSPQDGTMTGSSSESTNDMKLNATYTGAGWDFISVWTRSDALNSGYPRLR